MENQLVPSRAAANYVIYTDSDGTSKMEQKGKSFSGRTNENKSLVKVIWHDEADGRAICSALRAGGTSYCVSKILLSSGRCKKHGGMTPSGIAHPRFKTGRHSKDLPTRLTSRFEEALNDPDMHQLDADIALIDARIADLLSHADEGGSLSIYDDAMEAYQSLIFANQDGDQQAAREAKRRLESALKRGQEEQGVWTEVHRLQEQRRKFVLAEAKRLQTTNQMITVTKVNLLISALLGSVQKHVTDRHTLSRISEDFLRLTNQGQ